MRTPDKRSNTNRSPAMSVKVIVSYDGTANEDDAIALRRKDARRQHIVAVGDSDGGARATAEALANAVGATVEPVANEATDLLVVDSRHDAPAGRISLSSSAAHLIEIATGSVLVVPRGVSLPFAREPAPISA